MRERHPLVAASSTVPRVLFVSQSGAYGGAEFALVEMARYWRDSARVVLFSDGPVRTDLEGSGVGVKVLDAGGALLGVRRESRVPSPGALLGLVRLSTRLAHEAKTADLLYANSQKGFIVAALASQLARRPLIWHLRDIFGDAHFSQTNTRAAVFLANRFAARVLANSDATAQAFIARGGSPKKVRALPYGIDPAPFLAVTAEEIAATRQSLNLGAGPVVGVFGRLAPWKGQHVAIDAISGLPDVQLLIVGDAMFGEHEYAAQLQRQARDMGVANRLRFLGFRSDVPVLMCLVDVVMHTSISAEPFGRVILEGMLAGRPVVATDAGGAREIVQHEVTGLLVSPGDAGALRQAVDGLLRAPARRQSFGTAGRDRAITHFSPAAMLESIADEMRAAVHAKAVS